MQDNDYNYRHDQNVVSINSLRKEIEDLRFLLNEKNCKLEQCLNLAKQKVDASQVILDQKDALIA